MTTALRFASAGLGHGSTALIIGCVLGLEGLPKLDGVVFSDTGNERPSTYEHADRFATWIAERGVELHRTKREDPSGTLMQSVRDRVAGRRASADPMPFHLLGAGRSLQGCTRGWKKRPLNKFYRAIGAGVDRLEILIGYTVEELLRCQSQQGFILNENWPKHHYPRYPMVHEVRWRRGKCVSVIEEHLSWPVSSSCCTMCPHRPTTGPGSFEELLHEDPETFAEVEQFDAEIRDGSAWGLKHPAYLSSMRLPLRDAIGIAKRQGYFPFAAGDGSCDGGTCFT